MKIKTIFKYSLFCVIIFIFFAISSLTALAENSTSLVTTKYELYDELTSKEQMSIIKGRPLFEVKEENENVILVYRNKGSQILSQEKVTTFNPTKEINNKNNFPKMNSIDKNLLSIKLGYILIIIVVLVVFYKMKKVKAILFIFIVAGSLNSYIKISEATEYGLPDTNVDKIAKGSIYNKDVSVEGYEYLGYLHKSNDGDILPIPVLEGEVVIHYKDTEGNEIAKNDVIKGKIGESYRVEEKQIDGYKLKETVGYIEGLYSKEPVEVIFVYSKEIVASEGEVVIHYKDTEGNEIAENDVIKGKIGESYRVEEKQIDGYKLKET
ncbi:hypothetical protein CI088_01595, partial [Enterococcus plantarum]